MHQKDGRPLVDMGTDGSAPCTWGGRWVVGTVGRQSVQSGVRRERDGGDQRTWRDGLARFKGPEKSPGPGEEAQRENGSGWRGVRRSRATAENRALGVGRGQPSGLTLPREAPSSLERQVLGPDEATAFGCYKCGAGGTSPPEQPQTW